MTAFVDEEEQTLIVAVGEDSVARVRDPAEGEPGGELSTDHEGVGYAVAVVTTREGSLRFAVGGADGVVRLRDWWTGAVAGELAHGSVVRSMSVFTGLGGQTLLATAGEDGTVGLRNLMSGQDLSEPFRHCGGVSAVAAYPLSDLEAMLITGGDDETVRFWHCDSGPRRWRFPWGFMCTMSLLSMGSRLWPLRKGLLQVSLEAASNLAGTF